tara:strand:+ start:3381 stop:4055 length:675 start_codon:yes stop_codon:yes gene_type:complete
MPLPKPYFQDEWVTIYHGDCREILPELPKVDLVLTDPSYGVNLKKSGEPYMAGDSGNLMPLVLPLLYKLLKPDGALFIFSSVAHLKDFLYSFETYFKMHNIIIWDKVNPVYPHSKAHFQMQYEPIIYGSRGLHYLQDKKPSDIIRCPIVRGKNRVHPTQKPVELIMEILKPLRTEQRILDPFLGSGTIALAAIKTKNTCIGVEIEEKYCEMAAIRYLRSLSEEK